MSVSFVASSGTTYTIATSQNQTIPTVSVGDLLVAVVMHRATLTPAAGWTLVASQSCTGSSTTQFTSVYKRVAQSGDSGSSTTWTQASSQRIAVHILAFTASGGCDVIDFDTASQNNDTTASNVGDMAVSTATANDQMGVSCASTVIVNSSPSATAMSASVGTLTTPSSAVDNRLAVAYRSRNIAGTTSGTFTTNSPDTTTSNGWACVSLIVGDVISLNLTADQTIDEFTNTFSSEVLAAGSANQDVSDFTQSFIATVTSLDVSASAAQAVDVFTNAAALEFVVTSDTPQGLEDFAQVATGTLVVEAAVDQAAPAFTQVFTGFPVNPLSIVASQTIPAFTNAATGTILVNATAAKAISAFIQVATAHPIQPVSGSASQTFDAFTQSATLHRGDQTPGLIFKGTIGNVSVNRRGLATFEARSSLTLGRGFISERFGPACRADLYDARCKVNKDSFKATATVATAGGQFTFTVTTSPDVRAVDGWYDMGQGVIETGDNAGSPFAIKTWTAASLTVETMEPIDMLVSAGDTLTLYPGCDKSSSMCINRYANVINYRGEEFAANRDLQLTTQGA